LNPISRVQTKKKRQRRKERKLANIWYTKKSAGSVRCVIPCPSYLDYELKLCTQAARSRLDKATAAAHARNKATFNPQAQPAAPKAPPKPKLHPHFEDLSDDSPVASTSAAGGDSSLKRKRKSLRTQTVLNTTATVKRLKEIEHNRVHSSLLSLINRS
jgi:hypothetical protein